MNRSLKICKYQLKSSVKSIMIFYAIFLGVLSLIAYLNKFLHTNTNCSVIEFSTIIFIFICALNSFKYEFYFSQGNNISRKSFLKGTVLYGISLSAILAFIDIIINRLFNLVVSCPMGYDSLYGNAVNLSSSNFFIPNNAINYLISTYLFNISSYIFWFMLAFFIGILMFRLNKSKKFLLLGILVAFIIYINVFSDILLSLMLFITNSFGLNTFNPYKDIISFNILSIIIILGQYLLIRKVEANKN